MRNIETIKKIKKYSPKKILQKVLNQRNKIYLVVFGEEIR